MSHKLPRIIVTAALVPLFAFSGCSASDSGTAGASDSAAADGQSQCIPDGEFDAERDYFPEKATFEYATGVTVEYHNSYKVITIEHPSDEATEPLNYVLVQCGAPAPELDAELADAQQIQIPISRAAVGSSTTPLKFTMLDSLDAIVGTVGADKIWDESFQERYAAGEITDFSVGDGTTEVNTEKLVSLDPDLYIVSGHYDPSKFSKIQEVGIPTIAEPDYLETTPLGRTEYLKYIALFLDKEQSATDQFGEIVDRYNDLKETAAEVTERPTVLSGYQMKGTWYLKSSENYGIEFLRDAGADYVFSDLTGTASAKLDTEQVVAQASDAQFWLDGGINGAFSTVSEAVAVDSRVSALKAVQDENLWDATKQTNDDKGNNYWQAGLMAPDQVLGDLIAIFHPELEPDHEFVFYQKVPA